MEFDLQATWTWITDDVVPYLAPVVYALAFAWAGELSKRYVVNERNVRWARRHRDRLWNAGGWRRVPASLLKLVIAVPLPAHPPMAAAVLAFFPLPTLPDITDDYWHRLVVIGASSLISLALYDLAHAVLRKKGLDFKLPGEASDPPPPPKPDPEDDL